MNEYEIEVKKFLGPKGPLAQMLDRYEHRPEQGEMAAAVLRALDGESMLIVEAGTGTGKTLAYLTPALYSGRRVVISTATKALQEQLVNKDLPVLARHFKVSVALMKGRSNYLCWKRHHEFGRSPSFQFREEVPLYDKIGEWASSTQTGDRAEVPGLPDDYGAWRELSATSEQCVGQRCEHFRECFITRMRARAQEADIVVVNHHLFFADLSVRGDSPGAVLPAYGAVIFDEAHALPEIATEHFGVQASTWRLLDFSQDLRRLQRLAKLPVADIRKVIKALEKAELSASSVFKAVENAGRNGGNGKEGARFSLAHVVTDPRVVEEADRAESDLKDLAGLIKEVAKSNDELEALAERAQTMAADLAFIVRASDVNHVYWAETRGRGVFLRASPIELGPILGPRLFEPRIPLIFTSATLAVKNKAKWAFGHFKSGLGLTDPPRALEEVHFPSSYNWKENAVLYVPRELPDPQSYDYIGQAAQEMEKVLAISKGRAFLLFTSYRNLEAAHALIAHRLPYLVLKQGEAPKQEILDRFRKSGQAVLFATQSFWEGVDVSGQALSCVIIDKLPFDSPSDPLVAARIDRIRKLSGNPFGEYQLPNAVIALKQGLGRLIRQKTDYGILAVLDSRLLRKNYGRTFLDSLPPVPLVHQLDDLRAFMERHEQPD